MICRKCGAEIGPGDKFCGACGAAVETESIIVDSPVEVKPEEIKSEEIIKQAEEIKPEPVQTVDTEPVSQVEKAATEEATPIQDVDQETVVDQKPETNETVREVIKEVVPEEYKPISMWGYFGYELLFAVPVVGLIFIIIFAFGVSKNKNLQSFARSKFCWVIIGLVFTSIILVMALIYGLRFD